MSAKSHRRGKVTETDLVRVGAALASALLMHARERMPDTDIELRKRLVSKWEIKPSKLFCLFYRDRWPTTIPAGLFRTLEHAVRQQVEKAEQAGHTPVSSPALRAAKAALA